MARQKYIINKNDLQRLYCVKKKSAIDIAKIYGCDHNTILRRLREFNIPITFRLNILKSDLVKLYQKENKSTIAIAKIYNCTPGAISYKLNKFGIPRKSKCQIHIRYPKYDFSGNTNEKAYLIGFRLGDLNVYKTKKEAETIVVRCHTTQKVQVDLMDKLFKSYGRVSAKLQKDGTIYINCFLNKTFDFLMSSEDKIEKWISSDGIKVFCAFMAGYTDAEGNFIINQGRARFKIDSYDKNILSGMHLWLHDNEIQSKLRIIGEKGQMRHEGYLFNEDLWRLNINEANSLMKFISFIRPFSLHKNRLRDMNICYKNIIKRKKRRTI